MGLGALAAAILLALLGQDRIPPERVIRGADLPAVLARVSPTPESLAVVTDTALDPVHRDWLAAERAAGRPVRWGGKPAPVAVSVEPLADPAGGWRVLAAGPDSAVLRVADSLGALDSLTATGGGASVMVPRVVGGVALTAGAQAALVSPGDSLVLRPVVVFGAPTWETKFTIAALEERGWRVDARIPLSPDTAVVQGRPRSLDTARVLAVVALDGTAAREARAILAFVRQGGGLVLGPGAAAAPAFAALRPAVSGAREAAPVFEVSAAEPRRALALAPLERLAEHAVALERRGGRVAVAAHRVGLGRVVQLGYDETWRWRMAGPDGSVDTQRRWWTALVGSVAYRPTLAAEPEVAAHDAPLARMAAALGPAASIDYARQSPGGDPRKRPPWWLFVAGMVALVGEWASRRLRGAA